MPRRSAWEGLGAAVPATPAGAWLDRVLATNSGCAYLRRHGSPRTESEFRERVPPASYEDLLPWLARMQAGEPDVLFAGRPVAYERTGGSTGAAKLIPYSAEGLDDFRRVLLPWLISAARRHGVTGSVYLSISPATRAAESVGGIPVGVSDAVYLGEPAARLLAQLSAVPFEVGRVADISRWRAETLEHLRAARDLELISIWSPTFLLRLLEESPQAPAWWPRLKLVSCWASAASARHAQDLARLLPQAHLQPKGLLSTEGVVTVPDDEDQPLLTEHGFFEFERDARLHRADELSSGEVYSIVLTTASGLYRYSTGDLVRYRGHSRGGRAVLDFVGRGGLVSDLVGEKLTEPFVENCLRSVPGFRLLVPQPEGRGYVLAVEAGTPVSAEWVEQRLLDNPQYAYARRLGQLEPIRVLPVERLFERYVEAQLEQGTRLAEIKPVALRSERAWVARLEGGA